MSERSSTTDVDLGEEGWGRRLGESADYIAGMRAAIEDELEHRDELIVRACELGWSRAKVARWADVSPARVTQLLARPPAVVDERVEA